MDLNKNIDESDSEYMFEYVIRKKGMKKRKTWWRKRDENIERTENQHNEADDDDSDKEILENEENGSCEPEVTENNHPQAEQRQSNESHTRMKTISLDGSMKTPSRVKISASEYTIEQIETKLEDCSIQKPRCNRRALTKQSSTYELDKFERNFMVIINQVKVDGYEKRLGTLEDVKVLKSTFNKFGFEILEVDDPDKREIFEALDIFKTKDFTDYGCIAVVVLTHGDINGGLMAKDQEYSEEDIIEYFKVHDKPTLATKAKLLIIQACRGKECTPAANVREPKILTKAFKEPNTYSLLLPADTLVVHSSYKGQPSARDEIFGSWFIQTLCKKINEKAATEHLASILDEVKREVAVKRCWQEFDRATGENVICKQMPTVTSMLLRKLYLRRFVDAPYTFTDPPSRMSSTTDEPPSPMLVQFGPCSCYLGHFVYIKKCLMYYVEENPEDSIAQTFLDICNTLDNGVNFNGTKERMGKAIYQHLTSNAKNCSFLKYMFFYRQHASAI